MKNKLLRLLVKAVPMVLIVAMLFSQSVVAIPLKDKYNALVDNEQDFDYGVDTPRYSVISAEYAEKGYKNASETVETISVVPELTDGIKALAIEDTNEGSVFKWCNREEKATWKFNVANEGLYCIKFRYLLGEDGMAAVRSLEIDGQAVTVETNKINFYGLYQDDLSEGIKKNSLGDEIRPKQKVNKKMAGYVYIRLFGSKRLAAFFLFFIRRA